MISVATKPWPIEIRDDEGTHRIEDIVVVEEPLQILAQHGPNSARETHELSMVMRTPGHDEDLVAGLLFSEGLFSDMKQIDEFCVVSDPERPQHSGLEVRFASIHSFNRERTLRAFIASSACGVCGKAALQSAFASGIEPSGNSTTVSVSKIQQLLIELRAQQIVFSRTGALHGAALFDPGGQLIVAREDIGRHNAVDKVVGHCLREGRHFPLGGVLAVSGRLGFEIAQKAARAGIEIVVAVGAPSTLTLQLAHQAQITVVGFVRDDRLNVYTHPHRVS